MKYKFRDVILMFLNNHEATAPHSHFGRRGRDDSKFGLDCVSLLLVDPRIVAVKGKLTN